MANAIAPFGFRPIRHKNGAPYNGACKLYYVSTSSGLYIGDAVVIAGDANSTAYYGRFPYTLPTVSVVTAGTGNAVTGAIVGFFAETASSPVYLPASTARGVFVADDPDLVFAVMDNGYAVPTSTIIGNNANIDIGATSGYSGSAVTGLSGHTLDLNGFTTTSTLQCKVLGFQQDVKNTMAIHGVWEVTFNNHTNAPNSTGI
jgi:hypothetical protein